MLCGCFFNDTATTEIYTLSLHDALPILKLTRFSAWIRPKLFAMLSTSTSGAPSFPFVLIPAASTFRASGSRRSEEHTSELQSRQYLVCRLLLEKKNSIHTRHQLPDDPNH